MGFFDIFKPKKNKTIKPVGGKNRKPEASEITKPEEDRTINLINGVKLNLDDRLTQIINLGDEYCLVNTTARNGLGGYKDVNICLCRDNKLIRQITDERGNFLDFPGFEHGSWEKDAEHPLEPPAVRFVTRCGKFGEDGLARFTWMFQPDGRYYADEDGFGAEDDIEINLYSMLDKTGRFVTPFKPA
ncbi:MAG: hypothetical protein LUC97_08745 [Clostridiales bacterium]|nr:hypothetical protein [Clostridiales bacterium]